MSDAQITGIVLPDHLGENIDHTRLSRVVRAVLECPEIEVTEESGMVVAYSFERPERIRATWEISIAVAKTIAPWLCDVSADVWSMNLFTIEGIWVFPPLK